MPRFLPFLVLTACLSSCAPAAFAPKAPAPAGPAPAADAPLREADFVAVSTLRQLDRAVRAELDRRTREPMADAGQPFQSTDVVMEKLPFRRFVAGGHTRGTDSLWALCYEHGGIAYHYHVALLRLRAGSVEVVRAGEWFPDLKDRQGPVTLGMVLRGLQGRGLPDDPHW